MGRRLYSRRRAERMAEETVQSLGLAVASRSACIHSALSPAQKQIVEIARADLCDAPVIVLDEADRDALG